MKKLFSMALIVTLLLLFSGETFVVEGKGPVVSRKLNIESFKGIDLKGSFNVHIKYGTKQKVVAKGQQNIIDRLNRDVADNVWSISLKKGNYRNFNLDIFITVPGMDKIILSGSGYIEAKKIAGKNLLLKILGNGNINILDASHVSSEIYLIISGSGDMQVKNIKAKKTSMEISGSGNIDAAGESNYLECIINGSGNITAFNLKSNTGNISISGSGNSKVLATNALDVSISGSGDVFYRGRPEITQTISGSGNLINSN